MIVATRRRCGSRPRPVNPHCGPQYYYVPPGDFLAVRGQMAGDDERLRVLLEAWAELPESVKDAVMEMVRGYSSSSGGS